MRRCKMSINSAPAHSSTWFSSKNPAPLCHLLDLDVVSTCSDSQRTRLTHLFSDYASDKRKDLEERQFEKILELEWVQDGLLSWPCQMLPTHSMTITLFKELEKASRIASNYEHTKTPNLIAFSFGHKFWNHDVSYNTKIRMSSIMLQPYEAKLWCYSKS